MGLRRASTVRAELEAARHDQAHARLQQTVLTDQRDRLAVLLAQANTAWLSGSDPAMATIMREATATVAMFSAYDSLQKVTAS